MLVFIRIKAVALKEYMRKKIVALKRNPQMISIILIVIACCIYTFSLTLFSQAANQGYYTENALQQILNDPYVMSQYPNFKGVPALARNPAIYVFVITLLSFLLPITFLSVYKRGKTNFFTYSVSIAMVILMIVCNILYKNSLDFYMSEPWGHVDKEGHLAMSITRSMVHLSMLVLVLVSIVTKPFYSKLLNKIDTSVSDEYDKKIEQKSEDELLIEADDD